ncbi:DEAD/DEAH box helicase [Alcanivorax sp. IL3]|jgi:superfamily II DNA/RNA helicase|uniref:DEAD/DEAH box helicase n=1 Tax=Alcanivorax TaxID=59753 RepID=UPI000C352F07|nr:MULTISPECIES: DEAD/DEAH box helicase [Alcanivorax]MAC15596.1 RNA helicase [Alcanivorax sp.]MAC15957.1 RNA helicase [Alcanivorax sp.]MBP20971.1 RNA helicase [Alcanivorax sp.]MDF1635853.1 DEAD/DEAH box helicase [Alcanivorax jadensis]|tara:strand:+ start:2072 stop:3424 length:1353 start_codon:yes stop_codon:yes gene_type:complete
MTTFADLNLHERLIRALGELEITTPTPVQASAIPEALAGHDLRVVARTGSGKTAAFMLPMLHQLMQHSRPRTDTRALILLPTRELAQQTLKQVEALGRYTFIKAELVTGGEDFKVQAAKMRKNPEILIGTPGRLIEHLEAGNLRLQDLEMLVLDESDRMLDMGFSDDVLRLAAECRAERQTLLFSATSGGNAMEKMVASTLRDPKSLMLDSVRDLNESVVQQVITADDVKHKERLVQWLLANETYDKAVVFTNTREQADRMGGVLVASNLKVFVLHGEKDQKDRKLAMDRLKAGAVKVLVATDVAARGIHVDGLDLVINFDMPRSGDEYVHRIGRTGRVGGDGTAISLIAAHEWNLMAGIQRYLRQNFEYRLIEALKGNFLGPKNLKSNGKAAGSKKKKMKKKEDAKKGKKPARKKPVAKKNSRTNKPAVPDTNSGFATVKKRKNPGSID